MSYKNEWFLLEADDNIDEIEHREPTEEFLFYRAVATGDIETVRKNCEQGVLWREKESEFFQEICGQSEISLCDHDRDDHTPVQAERYGTGTGVPDERLLYPKTG